jgi:hypothetical protein
VQIPRASYQSYQGVGAAHNMDFAPSLEPIDCLVQCPRVGARQERVNRY